MLKLIYHTGVFGPIDLEYDRPVIRVGRNEDNDLVLRHPSIEPHHCLLAFRGERLLCLPPHQDIPSPTDLRGLTGPELGPGDSLRIGDLEFSLAHSSRTVAVHEIHSQGPAVGTWPDDPATGSGGQACQPRHFCPYCRIVVPDTDVKRVGLVGHAKLNLCPKCSRLLETEVEPQKPSPDRKNR